MERLLPRSHALALEPRIMFDGAAAVAADHQHAASHDAAPAATVGAAEAVSRAVPAGQGDTTTHAAAAAPRSPDSPSEKADSAARPLAVAAAPGAAPTVTLSEAATDALLGGNVTFTASFDNTSAQVGYAPYIDLFLPATGRDGDDGLSFVSATYLGQAVKTYTLTFDASGNATHPLALDATGKAVILHASDYGMRAGDQVIVVQLPYADISPDLPAVDIQVTVHVSDLADTSFSDGSPDLVLRARGGFELGNDAANNPTVDPSLIEAQLHDLAVHPTVVTLTQVLDVPDGKTVTGPNYERSFTLTATAAPGQSLSDVVITQDIPVEMRVTAITPGAGGTVESVTLHGGRVLTSAAAIQATLTAGAAIDSFTVSYASLTGAVDTTVRFYVPQADADGNPVIDPETAAPHEVAVAGGSATGEWQPLDPRDRQADGTPVDLSGTGTSGQFLVEAAALYKQVTVQTDTGSAGPTPGDTLSYTVQVQLSDYFALGQNSIGEGQFTVRDALGDGQTLVGTPTMTVTFAGATYTVGVITLRTTNADGSTSLIFDIGQSLRAAGLDTGALAGDLAFEEALQGATQLQVTYLALVGQAYVSAYRQSEINEGDSVGNNATLNATVLVDDVNLSGATVTDQDASVATVPTSTVDIELVSVNGTTPSSGDLHPGDVVTFQLSYDLTTGDYEQFRLTGYMPLPLFDITGITWSQGTGVGQWQFATGNTNGDTSVTVTSAAGNAVVFDFGDYTTSAIGGSRIVLTFTLRVGDQAFADQRSLSVLAQSDQLTTIAANHLLSSDVASIQSIAEPVVSIGHGVVSTSHGTVDGGSGTWAAPGSTGVPFSGSVIDTTAVEGDANGIDAGDVLRMATALENTGGGDAFDVVTSIVLPAGMQFVGGSLGAANLSVYRGDGTLLTLGIDYSVTGNTITFLDAGGVATLTAGRPGTAADSTGANVIVITYDAVVDGNVPASSTLGSTATLTHYASVDGGADFTPVDLSDNAIEQVAAPSLGVVYAGGTLDDTDSSAAHTTGSDLVIGESMLYDIVVTLPEGTTASLDIDSLIPAGMRLDTSFNGTGYLIITTRSGSQALLADFNGTVTLASFSGVGGTPGADGVSGRFMFSASSAAGDNVEGNNQFVIRVRLVASNTLDNQAGRVLQTNAQLAYTDPDGDVVGGSATERQVAATGTLPTVTVREPTVVISQTAGPVPQIGVDEGDTLTYEITLSNGTGASDFNAYDITFSDTLPTTLQGIVLLGVTYAGGATHDGSSAPDAGFVIVNGVLRNADGSVIDIPKGGSIVLRFSGQVTADAVNGNAIDNTASVRWTSLDGSDAGERTGTDGTLGSGVLNDYSSDAVSAVPVARGVFLSRVGGLDSTLPANPTNADSEDVTVGEVIRYRAVSAIGEGTTADYSVSVTLQNGLSFIDDGTVRIAFVSNNGITTTITALVTGGMLQIVGNEDSDVSLPLTASLSNDTLTGVLSRVQYEVTTDAQGNTVVTFHLGTLTNSDSDADLEGVVIEFNARVANQASVVAGAVLGATATERAGSTVLATSTTIHERIVEAAFNNLDKRITAFDPNPGGSTGTAAIAIRFTQAGSAPAYDVRLVDAFPGGSGYVFDSITIGGSTYGDVASLPAGVQVTVDPVNGIVVTFDRLDPGVAVQVNYHLALPNNVTTPDTDATLTWSSLPESFTSYAGSAVGADGAADGERTGSGVGPNTYRRNEGAGLGLIQGTLWDDTFSPTQDATPDGTPLAGQNVTLTWAGADGDLATTGDNEVFTTTTGLNGRYAFGVLPAGVYRIDVPAGTITDAALGGLRVRIDSDAATPVGTVGVSLGEAASATADAGFVQQNDAPVNDLPGAQAGLEDTPLAIAPIRVSDVDAGAGTLDVVITVLHGTLTVTNLPAGLVVGANGSASVTLSGTLDMLNAALASLVYLGNTDYNGNDTLTVQTRDRGNTGDANGDGIPSQPADELSDTDSLQITLTPVNDAPVAVADTDDATEAGGNANGTPGVDPAGNVLANDTDVDIATNGDVLLVAGVRAQGASTGVVPGGDTPVAIVGRYGTLFIAADGSYRYVVDNDNAAVQALRLPDQVLADVFDYTVADLAGAKSAATLTVTIHGANDTPVAQDDAGVAVEAGGVANASGGSDGTGNVLANDTDVDSVALGETRTVTGIRAEPETDVGRFVDVAAGTTSGNGTSVTGLYGTLVIGADGSWRYVVDNNNAIVQGLVAGDTLQETFSYRVTDTGGLDDLANLAVTIEGSNDNPVASDDVGNAQAGSDDGTTPAVAATGDVLHVASRPGTPTQPGGNGIDTDVDVPDQVAGALTVTHIGTGPESAPGAWSVVGASTSAANGTLITGLYGTLHIGADGTYRYDADSTNATVRTLPAGATITETFTYEVTDTRGLTDRAQLVVTIHGANDAPTPVDDPADAIEAGGIANGTPGVDPSGNVLANDSDPDPGDTLVVTQVAHGANTVSAGGSIAGSYGTLTLAADGNFHYTVDNTNAQVQALRLDSDQLVDTFTYTVRDAAGSVSTATVIITIHGRNDAPVAVDDTAQAAEAGGTANADPGVDPTGNVLANDTDVDAGDARTVVGARAGAEGDGGTLMAVSGVTQVAGTYGTWSVDANGTWHYTVDNSLAIVQALRPGQSLQETFTYQMRDGQGALDTAQLTLTITGAWDAPVARNDLAYAVAPNPGGTGRDPTGTVLANDSDVDAQDILTVTGVRAGNEGAAGALAGVIPGTGQSDGTVVTGLYGTLRIGADGTYQYLVDVSNPVLQALGPLQFVTDVFTYRVGDLGGLTDLGQLTILVRGTNSAPTPHDDAATAIEAGGIENATPGLDPSGNVLGNDTDREGDALKVTAVRTGGADDAGQAGVIGTSLRGQYGDLSLAADGTWHYVLDNSLPAVQALRTADQHLVDTFTYTVVDFWGASATAELVITVNGSNDTPVAHDDVATAVEAGGVANQSPGVSPTGNVLDNDTDVDSVALGESRTVISVVSQAGSAAAAGERLVGRYGWLTLQADGSYLYDVDNDNAAVQALRTSAETLDESFTYTMRDTAGATSVARLVVTIRGANDNPVARDDHGIADDQVPAPQTRGNVLSNDSDVDAGDSRQVVAVRAGDDAAAGASAMPGQTLAGRYGTLVLQADGSYTYTIDMTNTEVLAAAGLGRVLHDTFIYTARDLAGADAQALLTIDLDIAAPYIPPPYHPVFGPIGPNPGERDGQRFSGEGLPDVDPIVYVGPAVERDAIFQGIALPDTAGDFVQLRVERGRSASIGAGLGHVAGQYVGHAVRQSQERSDVDLARFLSRHGRVSLSADGLLSDPSLFARTAEGLWGRDVAWPAAQDRNTAESFPRQLKEAARARQSFTH
ncbi:VCBS domain-containing protein [Luteibacter aegosomatissinici]|uniref:VCBS domain-containing protein n=1 Tax=Luteibacter aegosomatissinici TaxID=2911539 RepID=UPI001FF9707C|nr:VCBS domain-containing protein [Luteibacter aegosomatissinici]UPG95554.1 VCBS domain-containing protein [Luteibacter aegosomatissinici]